LDVAQYFQGLFNFIDTSVAQGFIHAHGAQRMLVSNNAGDILQQMQSYEVTAVSKWQAGKGVSDN
jgi:predicted Rossmann-fold nucleotide-binding protein